MWSLLFPGSLTQQRVVRGRPVATGLLTGHFQAGAPVQPGEGHGHITPHPKCPTVLPSLEKFYIASEEKRTLLAWYQHHWASLYFPVTEVLLLVTKTGCKAGVPFMPTLFFYLL